MKTDKEILDIKAKIRLNVIEKGISYKSLISYDLDYFEKRVEQQAVKDFAKKIKLKLFDKCELNPIVLKIIDDELKTYGVGK